MEGPSERLAVDDPNSDLLGILPINAATGGRQIDPFSRQNDGIPLDRAAKGLHLRLKFGPISNFRDLTAQLPGTLRGSHEERVLQISGGWSVEFDPPGAWRGNLDLLLFKCGEDLIEFQKRLAIFGAIPKKRPVPDEVTIVLHRSNACKEEAFVFRRCVVNRTRAHFIQPLQSPIPMAGGNPIPGVVKEFHFASSYMN